MPTIIHAVLAYAYGIRDGFEQPYELGSSMNVEHLKGDQQEMLDRGVNLGQFLRAGRNSQSYREGFKFI